MRELGNRKWLAAGCSVMGLAALLTLSYRLPGGEQRNAHRPAQIATHLGLKAPSMSLASARSGSKIDKSQILKKYAQLPLAFEAGDRASSDKVKFLARGDGYTLLLATNETVLKLRGRSNHATVLSMKLADANAAPKLDALEQLPGKSNYLIGNRPENWRTNVAQYRKVMESNVYKGVDLVYYGTQGQLEYDFDVAPGTDPSVIQFTFEGSQKIHMDGQGELVIDTPGGDVRLRKPVAYQQIGGVKRFVKAAYSLQNKNRATFQIAAYDPQLPLVIDPVLSYSTFLGGSNIDTANAIAVYPQDNTVFIAGGTFSTDFPTVHALQNNDGGAPDFSQDAFIAKISADGASLQYSTYLGGEDRDIANGIALDQAGNAYVIGTTLSPHFPVTTGSFDTECGGDAKCGATFNNGLVVSNAFVVKLNSLGSALLYSGFIGGDENVTGQAIAVDNDGNAYATGQTQLGGSGVPPFPITANALQTAFGGGTTDAFLTKISKTGTSIQYSTYLGGSDEEDSYGIAVDGNANAYITGLTYSSDFPTTAGVLQTTYGGAGDAFVAKINTDATGPAGLVYSTYLGGAGLDQGNAIAIDATGNAYVAGGTNNASFTFSPTGFQTAYGGNGDGFVVKLNPAGRFSYFTYVGGTNFDTATGIGLDPSGNVYVTGWTTSTDFPTAGSIFQPAYGGGNGDSYVTKLDPSALLLYSSYLGGTNAELATGIAVDAAGSAYLTGQTCSNDFPLSNALQSVPGGNCDAYIAKVSIVPGIALNTGGLTFSAQSLNTTSAPETITLTNGDNPQTLGSIVISGANPGDFAQTNTCLANPSLAIGAVCTISVTFTPTAPGVRKATIVFTDTAVNSPQIVNLTGNTSSVTLSASSLAFGSVQVGSQSPLQTVTVTNNSNTSLTISNIIASGDFAESDTCVRAILQAQTNCVITVAFIPSAAINSVGAITIYDNGAGSPQVILATGTGVALAITTATPTPTISAGQSATYALSVPPIGGNGQAVRLTCAVMEANSHTTCQVSPGTVSPTYASPSTATMTVSTAVRTSLPPSTVHKINPLFTGTHAFGAWLLSLAAMMAICLATLRRRIMAASFGFAIMLLLATIACGGSSGGAGSPSSTGSGTPAQTYHVTVVGTAATGASSSTQVILQVN